MAKEIIINVMQEETRVAVMEKGAVMELYIDRKKDRGIVGNVYKGKVMKVLPGMHWKKKGMAMRKKIRMRKR